jgi:hypothetical protein
MPRATDELGRVRRYVIPDPACPPSDYTISSLAVVTLGGHDHVQVFNRGGSAGMLVLGAGDAALLAACCGLVAEDPGEPSSPP